MGKRYYTVNHQEIPLTLMPNAKLVIPARECHPGSVAARLGRSNRLALMTDVSRKYLVFMGDENKFKQIRNYRDIHATRAAYRDPNGLELYLTNHINVRFNEDLNEKEICQLGMKYDFIPESKFHWLWQVAVLDHADEAPLELANQLSKLEQVIFAEPDALQKAKFEAMHRKEDIRLNQPWHLLNTGEKGGTYGADVRALHAWEVSSGSPRIRVILPDSGTDIHHADLAENMLPGWDFDNEDANAFHPDNAHGTACAGVICAAKNSSDVMGIAPACRLVPLRAAYAHTWSTWAQMFRWAAQRGDIIVCSWSLSLNETVSIAIRDVIQQGRLERGIPVFCATGNWGIPRDKLSFPASLEDTISVGASTNRDDLADFSNFGTGIDMVAPGVNIKTTDITNTLSADSSDYATFSGTSAATSLTAGIGALLFSVNPLLSTAQVRLILRESADKIDQDRVEYNQYGWSREYGFGRVNADRAVRMAEKCRPVAFRAVNEQYLCAENGGDGELMVNRSEIVTWETFQMLPVGANKVALIAYNGQYLCVKERPNREIITNKVCRQDWEIFTLEELSHRKTALKTKNNRYLYAEDGGGGKLLVADDLDCGWEVFTIIRLDTGRQIALRASNGKYVGIKRNTGDELVADRSQLEEWETFDLVDLENGKVALRAYDGHYISAEAGGGRELFADRIMIAGWQSFEIEDLGQNNVALKAANGQYVGVENDAGRKLVADRDHLSRWETFSLIEI